MEWSVKSNTGKSTITDVEFQPGDIVISYISHDENGEIARKDILKSEEDSFKKDEKILGWWSHVVKDEEDPAEAKRQALKSSEDLFLSLFEEESNDVEDVNILKYLLSIILERKRIIKNLGVTNSDGQIQHYIHVKEKKEYEVPIMEINAETIERIQNQIGFIMVG